MIISNIEFHHVLTSRINSFGGWLAALHCAANFSRCCGDDHIKVITFLSFEIMPHVSSSSSTDSSVFGVFRHARKSCTARFNTWAKQCICWLSESKVRPFFSISTATIQRNAMLLDALSVVMASIYRNGRLD